MARKSKFLGKVAFIDKEELKNKRSRSPYVCVMEIEDVRYGKKFYTRDSLGREDAIFVSKHELYKKIKIMDELHQHHLFEDFIKGVFR